MDRYRIPALADRMPVRLDTSFGSRVAHTKARRVTMERTNSWAGDSETEAWGVLQGPRPLPEEVLVPIAGVFQ